MRRMGWLSLLVVFAVGCTPTGRDLDGPTCRDGITNGTEVDVDCGGSCAPCVNGKSCRVAEGCASGNCSEGTCQAPSDCTPEEDEAFCARLEKNCGDVRDADTCGDARTVNCGSCQAPQTCGRDHVCGGGASCTPKSCAELGAACGKVPDGCGGQLDCGGCPAGESCTSAHQCAPGTCQPETDRQFCVRLGKNCGSVTDFDNCDASRTVSCGTCSGDRICGGATPNVCCQPETDQQLCARMGRACGPLFETTDNCGEWRQLSCGTCPSGQACLDFTCRANSSILSITSFSATPDPQPPTGWGHYLAISITATLSGRPNTRPEALSLTFTAGPSGESSALEPSWFWNASFSDLSTMMFDASGRLTISQTQYLSAQSITQLYTGPQVLELYVRDEATDVEARRSTTLQITSCAGMVGSNQQLACAPENLCKPIYDRKQCGGCEPHRNCDRRLSLVSESGTSNDYPYCEPSVAACVFRLGGRYWTCNEICRTNHAHCIKGPDGTSGSCGSQPLTSNKLCYCAIDP